MFSGLVRRAPQVLPLLAGVAAVAFLAAGCGGSGGSPQVAQLGTNAASTDPSSTTTNGTPSRQDFQTAILAYTRCMRANGVQMADPNFNGSGGGGCFFRLNRPRNDPKFRQAQSKCRSKLNAIRPQFTPAQQQQFQQTALKFAQCMRKHGVNVPDPSFNGGGGGGRGLFGGGNINPNDPKVRTAIQACRSVFSGNGRGRRGGFFFGGPPPGGGSSS